MIALDTIGKGNRDPKTYDNYQPVFYLNYDFDFLDEFESMSEAGRVLGINPATISLGCKHNEIVNSYSSGTCQYIRFFKTKEYYNGVKAYQNGKCIKVYKTIKQAAEDVKISETSIRDLCKTGKVSTICGKSFKRMNQ
ncbi:MAG: NUMOD1 domain-containing DNA-binding protein [Magnetococcus sp. YQC-3]